MKITTYQNKQNPSKYIQMKRYDCGHYYARQYMYWETDRGPVTNYMGVRRNSSRFHRNGIRTLGQVLMEDYEIVSTSERNRL